MSLTSDPSCFPSITPQEIPARLLKHKQTISNLKPLTQEIEITAHDWEKILPEQASHLRAILPRFEDGIITRGDVLAIGQMANYGRLDVTDLFAAAMIWGFGTVGYGRWRVKQMFTVRGRDGRRVDTLKTHLERITEHLHKGRLLEAYEQVDICRCGPAFFTKYFYFVGLACKVQPLPLILDALVANSLKQFSSLYFNPIARYGLGKSRSSLGYIAYVCDMNAWALDGGFSPDQLEMFLFSGDLALT
jgi:hypothetical protein